MTVDSKTESAIKALQQDVSRLEGAIQGVAKTMREDDAKVVETIRGWALPESALGAIEERLSKKLAGAKETAGDAVDAANKAIDVVNARLSAFGLRIDRLEADFGEMREDLEKLIQETRWTRRAAE